MIVRRSRLAPALAIAPVLAWAGSAAAQLSSAASSNTGSTCGGSQQRRRLLRHLDPGAGQQRHAPSRAATPGTSTPTSASSAPATRAAPRSTTSPSTRPRPAATGSTSHQRARRSRTAQRRLGCDGAADTSGVTGSTNFALSSGTSASPIPAPSATAAATRPIPYQPEQRSAHVFRVSNGAGQGHTLTFTWNGSVRSNSCEAAVRQGESSGTTTGCSDLRLPGQPRPHPGERRPLRHRHVTPRSAATARRRSVGEQCDLGGANGAASSCCTTHLQFRPRGQVCRASAGVCDLPETCTGSSATCPADAKSTAPCRAVGRRLRRRRELQRRRATPARADGFVAGRHGLPRRRPASATSPRTAPARRDLSGRRRRAGEHGVPRRGRRLRPRRELRRRVATPARRDGSQPAAPSAAPSAGVCDVAETCDGVGDDCPARRVAPTGTACRASAGVCDVAETCDGVGADCPADAAPSSTECRASAGDLRRGRELHRLERRTVRPTPNRATTECRARGRRLRRRRELRRRRSGDCPADACRAGRRRVPRRRPASATSAETCNGSATACPADAQERRHRVPRGGRRLRRRRELRRRRRRLPGRQRRAGGHRVPRGGRRLRRRRELRRRGATCPATRSSRRHRVPRRGRRLRRRRDLRRRRARLPGRREEHGASCRAAAGVCDVAETCDGATEPARPTASRPRPHGLPPVGRRLRRGRELRRRRRRPARPTPGCPTATATARATRRTPARRRPTRARPTATATASATPAIRARTLPAACSRPRPKLTIVKLADASGRRQAQVQGLVRAFPTTPAIDPVSERHPPPLNDATGRGRPRRDPPRRRLQHGDPRRLEGQRRGHDVDYKNAGNPVPLIAGITKVSLRSRRRPAS